MATDGSDGGEASFAAWLDEGYDRSLRVAYLILGNRPDAEDAVQDAFLRAWRFRASLADAANVSAWMYRVVVNACHSMLRREVPRRRREDGDVDEVATDDPAEEVVVAGDVARALADLPEGLRVVVVLRYYAGLSEAEIARAIARKPGTVKSRLFEARRLLGEHPALADSAPASNDPLEVTR